MKITAIGALVVTLALFSYSIAIISEQKKRLVTKTIITFLAIGVVLDISATICMIIGSTNSPFTLHGVLGYFALTLMIVDTVLLWNFYTKNSSSIKVPNSIHSYSRIAYICWILAYATGCLMSMSK